MKSLFLFVGLLFSLVSQAQNSAVVNSSEQLRAALQIVKAGQKIIILPGIYEGGFYAENLRGTPNNPIIITGFQDRPALFKGGGNGLHIAGAEYLEVRDLKIEGARNNGLNIDDGGVYTRPSRYITLKNLQISNIGPQGNHDGMKLSGVDDFRIENCRLENWGTDSGSGIDMVGCHKGVITKNTFMHQSDPRTTGGSGVQAKGGCRDIQIQNNRFENAGHRAVNIGGSTGLEFFRPPLNDAAQWPNGKHEAQNITVEGNVFIGSLAPLAFVGVDGARVRFNTIYHPGQWALRILQETNEVGFVPSRNGIFSDNIVVFRAGQWIEGGVNIGPKTAPETFEFARNFWFNEDNPARSRPNLPNEEKEGVYGQDPLFQNAPEEWKLKENSPAQGKGASAWRQLIAK
ncbi:MAG TPA: right-handed parallel beta-helix repeat-containing protein [Abditibacteriaceae bacterium]|jgi:hypothetical protein